MIHNIIDDVADGITNGINSFGSSIARGVKDAGHSVMDGLNRPFREITGKDGPTIAINKVGDGVVDATSNFFGNGVVGSARIAGKGVMSALDQPVEQLKGGMGRTMKMPWQK